MIRLLRKLARRWASALIKSEADQLRRQLIRAEAAATRHKQTADGSVKALLDAGQQLGERRAQIMECLLQRQRAERERDAALAEIAELRRYIADADNAAARNEARQP